MKSLVLRNKISEVAKIRNFLNAALSKVPLSEEVFYWLELSTVEMSINVIRYAFPEEDSFSISVWFDKQTVYVEIRDKGIPFDPSNMKSPVIEDIIKVRKEGGFGIFLARRLMDGFQYQRKEGENILTMIKKY